MYPLRLQYLWALVRPGRLAIADHAGQLQQHHKAAKLVGQGLHLLPHALRGASRLFVGPGFVGEVLDRESNFMAVAEAEWEAYSNNVTLSIREDNYVTLLAKFLGEDAPDEVQEQMLYDTDWVYDLMECRGTDIETLMQEHPLDPREASETLSKRPDTEAITGQLAAL